jgi:GLPGLI family protein
MKFIQILFFTTISFAQNTIIEYKVLPNKASKAFSELQQLSSSEVESKLKLVTFSLLYNEDEMKFYANDIPEIVKNDIDSFLLISDIQGIYHRKNNSNDLYIEIDEYGDEKNFIVRKKWITDWTLTNEKKLICGYECLKATCILNVDYGDDNVNKLYPLTAWYCPELKYSYGPKGYGGLVGVILEVEELFVVYRADKITINEDNEKIALPNDKKIITESKMYDLMDETINKAVNKCQSEAKQKEMLKVIDTKT